MVKVTISYNDPLSGQHTVLSRWDTKDKNSKAPKVVTIPDAASSHAAPPLSYSAGTKPIVAPTIAKSSSEGAKPPVSITTTIVPDSSLLHKTSGVSGVHRVAATHKHNHHSHHHHHHHSQPTTVSPAAAGVGAAAPPIG
eukprot:PhF_6_TR30872/c0_g1_i3/m.45431